MGKSLFRVVMAALLLIWVANAAGGTALFQAIRKDDLTFIRHNLSKTQLEARDNRGATPLMHAAAFGSIEALKLLLDAGADVNARNDFGATALLWCARDGEKARLLIQHGAGVNARSKQGRTPLMLASMREGGSDLVALLLSKGADVNAADTRGETALGLAAEYGDIATVRLLIASQADIHAKNRKGETPVIAASTRSQPEIMRLLIQKGAAVDVATNWYATVRNGQIQLLQLTALHHAAQSGSPEMVRGLLRAGASVNAPDSRGFRPLIFAIAEERQNPEIVQMLIAAGADVNARDKTGETPLDWAEKFGHPGVIAALKKAGARPGLSYSAPEQPESARPNVKVALARSMDLLQKSSVEFFKNSGCVGCHHQPMAARAQRLAKAAGIPVNEDAAREQMLQLSSQWAASQEEFLQALNPGGGANRLGENLLALDAAGYPADVITDSAVVDFAQFQAADGRWPGGEAHTRPPITEGEIGSTARAIRTLQVYSIPARKKEFDERIARARAWLAEAKSLSTDDFAMRLLGLWWAGADKAQVQKSARLLQALQREDGGWSGTPYLKSDAYATGEALYALRESSSVSGTDPVFQRGVDYLLATQFPDGSWHVRSRAMKFQPYFESGFAFGHDQWISAAATAWASMALSAAVAPQPASVARKF
jgi:ankyrin repeat protein